MTAIHESAVQICEVGPARLPYAEHGAPDGRPPLILFGGISTPVGSWRGLPEELDRHVLAVGTPIGNRYPRVPTIEGYAAIMGRAAMQLVQERYGEPVDPDVAGWSWGGLAAQAMALSSVARVRRMILLASVPAGATFIPELPRLANMRAATAIIRPNRGTVDPKVVYGEDFEGQPELAAEFEDMIHREIDPVAHRRQLAAAACSGTLVWPTMASRWAGMGPDTLVGLGARDRVIPVGLASRLARNARMQVHIVPDGGHLYPVMRKEETAEFMNGFLDYELAA